MAGRLGVIGDNTPTTPVLSGRLGRVGASAQDLEQQKTKDSAKTLAAKNIADAQTSLKQTQDSVFNPFNIGTYAPILGDIGKAAGNVVKGAGGLLHDTFVQPVVDVANQVKVGQQVNKNLGRGNNPLGNPVAKSQTADELKAFNEQDVKSGRMSQAQADTKNKSIDTKVAQSTEAVSKAEQSTGIKYDPSSADLGILNTALNLTGVGEVPKLADTLFRSAYKTAATKLGRNLTDDEVKNLATNTKTATDKIVPPETNITKSQHLTPEPVIAPPQGRVPSTERLGAVEPTTPFKPLDKAIQAKIDTVTQEAGTKPLEVGNTRLYQVIGADATKPQYFKDPNDLATAIKGNNPEVKVVDIPDAEAKSLITTPPEPVTTTGDTVSGNSLRIQQKAVEEKLNQNMGDLPQYKSINMKDQAERAVDLVTNDRQKAIDIIDGKANPPDGLHAQSVHQALEVAAIKEGDGELLTKLAKSHINTELSEGAQKLRIAAERDPSSAVEQIRQIRDARAKRVNKKTVSKEVERARQIVKQSTKINSKAELNDFIKGLAC